LFSPIIQYGTYTYKQIMLDPLAKALAAALRTVSAEGTLWPMPNLERPRVYFALQGERTQDSTDRWLLCVVDVVQLCQCAGCCCCSCKHVIGAVHAVSCCPASSSCIVKVALCQQLQLIFGSSHHTCVDPCKHACWRHVALLLLALSSGHSAKHNLQTYPLWFSRMDMHAVCVCRLGFAACQ
jgi:hypothetical protein